MKNHLRGWRVKDIISLIKCIIITHNMIVKERRSVCNFNFEVIFNDFYQPENEDDEQLNLLEEADIDFNDEVTTSIGSLLETMHANANDEHFHDLLRANFLKEFEYAIHE